MERIISSISRHTDTCNVYVIEGRDGAILIHGGNGSVLRRLRRPLACLNTHHFRPVVQGLPAVGAAGAEIYVPYWEQDMFAGTTAFWQERQTWNNYDGRWDRFAPVSPVKPAGYLMDHDSVAIGGIDFHVIPSPGPTCGGISLECTVGGRRVVFSGDLIYGPGKVWNLAPSQWNYNDALGACHWLSSLRAVRDRAPALVLPCHGEPMHEPQRAITELEDNLMELLRRRGIPDELAAAAYSGEELSRISEHLFLDVRSFAQTFYLISESGKALALDYGYRTPFAHKAQTIHFSTRRSELHGIEALRKTCGVDRIDTVIPTHSHDDHVSGIPLLQRLYGTRLWCPDMFADILERPDRYNIQCIWPEPMHVDRRLRVGEPIRWEEYSIRILPAGAHTSYSAMIEFEADGKLVVHVGDQQGWAPAVMREDDFYHNYVYQNRYRRGELERAAGYFRKRRPDTVISGHWGALGIEDAHIAVFEKAAREQRELHEALLPVAELDWDSDGVGAVIHPYRIELLPGADRADFEVVVRNPFAGKVSVAVRAALPEGWKTTPHERRTAVEPGASVSVSFSLHVPESTVVRKQPIAADVTIGGRPFGQIAEALVTVHWPEATNWGGGTWGGGEGRA